MEGENAEVTEESESVEEKEKTPPKSYYYHPKYDPNSPYHKKEPELINIKVGEKDGIMLKGGGSRFRELKLGKTKLKFTEIRKNYRVENSTQSIYVKFPNGTESNITIPIEKNDTYLKPKLKIKKEPYAYKIFAPNATDIQYDNKTVGHYV